MKTTGIFYGSNTGTTADVARQIAQALGVAEADIHDVATTAPSKIADYNLLVLGTSTWGDGELQDSWADFVAGLEAMDLTGYDVALFGTGDESMADTFCDGVGELYTRLQPTGARFVGAFNVDGYEFDRSKAIRADDGMAVGLLLDNTNHPDLSADRIAAWAVVIGEQTGD